MTVIEDRPEGARTRKILVGALDRIETRGWTQHNRRGEDGSFCLGEALDDAAGGDLDARTVAAKLTLGLLGFPWCQTSACVCQVFFWNDTFGRTHQEVSDALRAAIAAVGS